MKPLQSNNSNICVGIFNGTIISYFIAIVMAFCAIKIDIVTNPKYCIKKEKNIKDSNGINMVELITCRFALT